MQLSNSTRSLTFVVLLLWLCMGALSARAEASPASRPTNSRLFFEPLPAANQAPFQFVCRGADYLFAIAPTEARIVLQKRQDHAFNPMESRAEAALHYQVTSRSFRVSYLGANPSALVNGDAELPGKVNYFIGNDPAGWRCAVPMFAHARIQDLYPGISLIYYGNQKLLEYDFELAPGADPSLIALRFEGVDSLRVSEEGDLILRLGEDEIRQHRPEVYQIVNGERHPVEGGYQLQDPMTARFVVGPYNKGLPLVIDPTLAYSMYFGGNSTEVAFAVKVDASEFVYAAGETLSTDLGSTNGFQKSFAGGKNNGDAFVAKFDNTGTNVPIYFSYLGGSNDESALDIAVDSNQHVYLTGFTASPNFPATNLPTPLKGLTNHINGVSDPIVHAFPTDAFIAELDTTTNGPSSLVFSGFLGGGLEDLGIGIALDQARNVYVTGYTFSTNFPIVNGAQTNCLGSNDVFIAKIGADAVGGVLYSSYLGGTNLDEGQGIAVPPGGTSLAFVTGYTASTNFPITSNALKTNINATTNAAIQLKGKVVTFDAFVAGFDTSLLGTNSLIYSSYWGGSNNDAGYRITVDAATNVYITGNTASPDFEDTTNRHVTIARGTDFTNGSAFNYDAIFAKFGGLGSTTPTNFCSFAFGGKGNDVGWDLALGPAGDVFITGVTAFTNFPATNVPGGLNTANQGGTDAFISRFSPDLMSLVYSGLFGGLSNDFGYGIAVDATNSAYVVGFTYSTTNIAVPPVTFRDSTNDTLVFRVDPDPAISASLVSGQLRLSWVGTPFATNILQSSTNASTWKDVPGTPVQVKNRVMMTLPLTNSFQQFRLRRPD